MIKPYAVRTFDRKRPVQVYRNLTKSGGVWYSIRQDGLVVGHAQSVHLRNCIFHVNESGRQRVLRTGHKNVHAWVSGRIVDRRPKSWRKFGDELRAKYNPREHSSFRVVDPETGCYSPIVASMAAKLDSAGLTVWMPRA